MGFVHGGQDLFIEAFGRGDDLSESILLACKERLDILFGYPLVDSKQRWVFRFFAEDNGHIRFNDDRVPFRMYDLSIGSTATRQRFVKDRIRRDFFIGEYIGKNLPPLDFDRFFDHR